MNSPVDELDRRPFRPHHFFREVIAKMDEQIAAGKRSGVPIPDDVRARMKYAESVLLFGNSGGRSNKTIMLPIPWDLTDIESVIGTGDEIEPGSDAAWRAVRRKHDAASAGLGLIVGRTR